MCVTSASPLQPNAAAGDQRDHEQHQEHDEQDPGDLHREAFDSPGAEGSGDQRDQHLFVRIFFYVWDTTEIYTYELVGRVRFV